jgi:hypothetical protein
LTKGGPGRDIGALARPAYLYISDYVRICRISRDTNYGVPAYTQICRPNVFDILCRSRDAGLSDLQGWRSGIYGPGYGQRSYPGHISQLRCPIPAIKEENIQVWREIVVTGCTVVVYLPSLCTSTSLPQEGKVTVQKVRGTGMRSPIESNQGVAFVSKSYLECSPCLMVSDDRCNPGHHYIRWHRGS